MTILANRRAAYGTITGNTSTEEVVVTGYVTVAAHFDAGTGTITWEFKGPDGVWRSILGGSDNITAQEYTASNMVNFYFGDDVLVRGTVSFSSGLTLDYQILSNGSNRD